MIQTEKIQLSWDKKGFLNEVHTEVESLNPGTNTRKIPMDKQDYSTATEEAVRMSKEAVLGRVADFLGLKLINIETKPISE